MQLPSIQPNFDPPVPNQTELAFIRTANDIKAARISSPEHIPRLNTTLHNIAKALCHSMRRSGLQGFFNTYNLLAPDHPSLEALRSTLTRMVEDKQIDRSARGFYAAFSKNTPSTTATSATNEASTLSRNGFTPYRNLSEGTATNKGRLHDLRS